MKIWNSFGFRLFAAFTLFFFIGTMITSVLLSQTFQRELMTTNEQTSLEAFEVSRRRIEQILEEAYTSANLLRQSKTIEENIYTVNYESRNEQILANYILVQELLQSIHATSALDGVIYFYDDGSMVGTTDSWHVIRSDEMHPFYQAYIQSETERSATPTWIGAFYLSDFIETNTTTAKKVGSEIYFIGVSPLRYRLTSQEENVEVTQAILVSEERLRECFAYLSVDGIVTLLDGAGRQLSDTDSSDTLHQVPWFYNQIDASLDEGSVRVSHDGQQWQLIYLRLPGEGWMLVKQIPMDVYSQPLIALQRKVYLTGLALVLVFIGSYALWVSRFLKPFHLITKSLEKTRNGDLQLRIREQFHTQELELMRREYNAMLDSIVNLIDQSKKMEQEHMALELRSLQARLNPHMILNTISNISWLATLNGNQTIADMLIELSSLVQPIFREWRLVWTVHEELEYLEHYIRLLKLRFCGSPYVTLDIAESAQQAEVPCYILQPLFENSCEHGRNGDQKLHIKLSVQIDQEEIVIRVSDDGRGIEPVRFEALLAHLNKPIDYARDAGHVGQTGIGLYSIHRRIQLQYGEQYGLVLRCPEEGGTQISIRFPRRYHGINH